MNLMKVSPAAAGVIRACKVVSQFDIGFQTPPGMVVDPAVVVELERYARFLAVTVKATGDASIEALLAAEGLLPPYRTPPLVV